MRGILRGESTIDFMGRLGLFATISGVAVGGSIVAAAVLGLNFGIDFAGGYEIQAKFQQSLTDGDIKRVVAPVVGDARVQTFGEAQYNEFLIMVRKHGTLGDDVKAALKTDFEALDGSVVLDIAESGESIKTEFQKSITDTQVREVLERHGLAVKNVLRGERADRPSFEITLVALPDQIEQALTAAYGGEDGAVSDIVKRVEFVGPQVGAQLRNDGILAIIWALLFILLYVGVRFDLFFAPGAIVALVHDVSITVGVFALLQLEFNLPIIAAILAIVGYSLNDTIVVYDRIRENAVRLRGRELRPLVNTSLNQTLSRTLLTSFTTLLVIGALLIFGGGIIRDFSLALGVGVIVGTYSSIAIATPAYVLLRERNATAAPKQATAS